MKANDKIYYDLLSPFYNKYWTTSAPQLFNIILESFLLNKLSKKARILDLCCGTGQLCSILSRKYNITGLDNSDGMIELARKNAPKADFVIADACNFVFSDKFDAVYSVFDSLNHILDEEMLLSCFKCVKNSLKNNGYFLFDVNDEETFDENWTAGFTEVDEESICILKPEYDIKTGIAKYHSVLVTKTPLNLWKREDAFIYEKYYDDKTIFRLLDLAGFKNAHLADGHEDLGIKEFEGRHFFIAC